jgi:hypothetical protein
MDETACVILNKLSLVDPTISTFSAYQQNIEVGQFNLKYTIETNISASDKTSMEISRVIY